MSTFQADDARLSAMHGYAPLTPAWLDTIMEHVSTEAFARRQALTESFRRVRVDRALTRCEVESGRVLAAYTWPTYG